MKRSPRKMNFYHNRHRSDGKLIEKEERITTSDLENNYTNTEKNLSNNIIQIPKENNEEKYFEDSNKLIDSMEKLLNSFQIKLKIPQKNIITLSSNTFNNDIYKENIELRKEQKTLKERLKYLENTPISTNYNSNNKVININIEKLMDKNLQLDYENDHLMKKIEKLKINNKKKKIKNSERMNLIIKNIFNNFDELKYLLKPKINFEEEFSQTTTESNINEYYEDNYYNYEDYESDDSKIRENIFFNKNRNQKINSMREKNLKDYQILDKINDIDDKQRNTIIPSSGDNFLYQNLNQDNNY